MDEAKLMAWITESRLGVDVYVVTSPDRPEPRAYLSPTAARLDVLAAPIVRDRLGEPRSSASVATTKLRLDGTTLVIAPIASLPHGTEELTALIVADLRARPYQSASSGFIRTAPTDAVTRAWYLVRDGSTPAEAWRALAAAGLTPPPSGERRYLHEELAICPDCTMGTRDTEICNSCNRGGYNLVAERRESLPESDAACVAIAASAADIPWLEAQAAALLPVLARWGAPVQAAPVWRVMKYATGFSMAAPLAAASAAMDAELGLSRWDDFPYGRHGWLDLEPVAWDLLASRGVAPFAALANPFRIVLEMWRRSCHVAGFTADTIELAVPTP